MANDFQIFAGGSGANVITQAQYLALTALGPGFTTGVAASAQLNKVWRQASTMAALLGQIMANVTGQSVQDQGVLTALVQQYNSTAQLAEYAGTDSGSGNAYTIAFTGGTAGIFTGQRVRFLASHANTAGATLSVNGSAAAPIWNLSHNALTGAEIAVNSEVECIWNGAINGGAGAWVLIYASAGGATGLINPGYMKFANGVILNWGNGTYSNGNTITFAKAFPNAIWACVASGSTGAAILNVQSFSLASFVINYVFSDATPQTGVIKWLAVGN